MRILIGAPVRNRAWILPEYLKSIEGLMYLKSLISCCFILNDCEDNSKEILQAWKEKNKNKYNEIKILERNFNNPNDYGEIGQGRSKRGLPSRKKYIYKTLAKLRNLLLQEASLSEVDYLFSIDSDILINPDVLTLLLSEQKDIIAALVHNGEVNYNFLPFSGGDRRVIPGRLFDAKVTGAVYIISRQVFSNPVIQYTDHTKGEDCGFCESARDQGFKCWVLAEKQRHIMYKEWLKEGIPWHGTDLIQQTA